jgi:hypothetical protein
MPDVDPQVRVIFDGVLRLLIFRRLLLKNGATIERTANTTSG